jgi:ABC-type glycerol-3-phosphate transport system permease component
MSARLVEVDEFHYSKKGKEVNHYRVANKIIIITPKETEGFKEMLKKLLPIGIIGVGATFIIHFVNQWNSNAHQEILMSVAKQDSALMAGARSYEAAPTIIQTEPNFAMWFFFGCLFTVVMIIIFGYFRSKKR